MFDKLEELLNKYNDLTRKISDPDIISDQNVWRKYMKEQYEVKRLDKPVDWTVEVPGSKSMTNRALLMAALSDGQVKLEGVLFSDDSRHFLESLVSLGFTVDINEPEKTVTVLGCGGNIPKKQAVINVGSAGTAARFLTAMLGFSDGEYTIEASEQPYSFFCHILLPHPHLLTSFL